MDSKNLAEFFASLEECEDWHRPDIEQDAVGSMQPTAVVLVVDDPDWEGRV